MAAGDVDIQGEVLLQGSLRLVWGTVILDGGNPTPVELSSVLAACQVGVATLEGSVAPGDDPTVISAAASGTVLNVYAWKHTTGGAAGNPTLIASTDNARLVNWIAIGPKKAGV